METEPSSNEPPSLHEAAERKRAEKAALKAASANESASPEAGASGQESDDKDLKQQIAEGRKRSNKFQFSLAHLLTVVGSLALGATLSFNEGERQGEQRGIQKEKEQGAQMLKSEKSKARWEIDNVQDLRIRLLERLKRIQEWVLEFEHSFLIAGVNDRKLYSDLQKDFDSIESELVKAKDALHDEDPDAAKILSEASERMEKFDAKIVRLNNVIAEFSHEWMKIHDDYSLDETGHLKSEALKDVERRALGKKYQPLIDEAMKGE